MLLLCVNGLHVLLLGLYPEQAHDIDLFRAGFPLRELFRQWSYITRCNGWLCLDPISEPVYKFIIYSIITAEVNGLQACCPCQVVPDRIEHLDRKAGGLKVKVDQARVILNEVLESIHYLLVFVTQGGLCQTISLLLGRQSP